MNPSQYPMQQSTYIPGQDYQLGNQMSTYMPKDQTSDPLVQGYANPQLPVNSNIPMDPKQVQYPPNMNMGFQQGQAFPSVPNNFNIQDKVLMALQSLKGQYPNTNFFGPGSNMGTQSFPTQGQGQGQYNAPNPMGGPESGGYRYDQGSRNYSGGGYQNNRNKEHGFRGDDRGDRNDRGFRGDRNDRGFKGDRDRRDRSRDRSDRNDRGDRDRRFNDKGKNGDSYSSRERRHDRRSRSNSRDLEKRDMNDRKSGFNNRREGGDRFGGRGGRGDREGQRYPRGESNTGRGDSDQFNDWKCLDCGNVNWARRDKCNRCQVKRPENAPIVPKDPNRGGNFRPRGGDRNSNPNMNSNFDQNGDGFRGGNNPRPQGEEGL